MASVDPTLESYRARVEFSVGLRSFPYVKKTVHGDTYFKRPDKMELIFEDLPAYAAHFKNVFVGLGSVRDWDTKFLITLANPPQGGQGGAELILVPRKSSRLHDVHVLLDPQTSLPRRMIWHYNDGQIVLETTYVHIADHYVVASQHAEAHFPMFRGWAHSQVSQYAFNVPIDEAIFTPKKAAQ